MDSARQISVCFDRACRTSIVTRCLYFERWGEEAGFVSLTKAGWQRQYAWLVNRSDFFFLPFLEAYLSQSCSGPLCWDCLYLHMQRILLFWAHRWQDRAINHPQILPPCSRRPLQNTLPRRVCRCAAFKTFSFFLIPEEAPSSMLFVKTTSIFNRYRSSESASLFQYSLDGHLMRMALDE